MEVAFASSEFSMSSLMTDAGRWTTSPAAMRSTTCLGKAWIRGFSSGGGGELFISRRGLLLLASFCAEGKR